MMQSKILVELLQNYNRAIQKKCEQEMHAVKTSDDYEFIIKEARLNWEKTNFREKLPTEYFNEIKDKKEIVILFEIAAEICDEFIPSSLIKTIIETGVVDLLGEYAFGNVKIELKTTAIKVLGIHGGEKHTEKLINLLHIDGEFAELIKETARRALVDIGRAAIPIINTKLKGKNILDDDDFHLIIALMEIDGEEKSDAVYESLKDGFRKARDKALAARCLSDFGDGRAVPMLRSYLERNINNIDSGTANEIEGAVLKLGGSISGIDIPLKQ